jgi:hypothetical protein
LALLIGFYYLLRKDLGGVNFVRVLWRPVVAAAVMLVALVALWGVYPLLALLVAGVIYPVLLAMLRPLTAEESARIGRILPQRLRRTSQSKSARV